MKLYRSEQDKKIFGLCGGLAQMLNVDATLIRVLFIVTAVFSAGSIIFVYIVASLVIPKEPTPPGMYPPHGYTGPNGYPGAPNSSYPYGNSYQGMQANQPPYPPPYSPVPPQAAPPQSSQQKTGTELDEMMKDIEKKALWKEIEELRAKVAKYEKGDK